MELAEVMGRYAAGESATNLEKELGISKDKIWRMAKKKGIKRPTKFRTCLQTINHFYFSIIDSPQKAYWLGYLYADGSVFVDKKNRKYLSLHLHSDDKCLIEAFLKDIQSTHKVTVDKRGYLCCRISSQKMCEDLINLGVVPKKTYVDMSLPNIEFKDSFIRGFLDGDGCIYKDSISFCSHKPRLLQEIYNEICLSIGKKTGSLTKQNGSWSLVFGGSESSLRVYNYIYKNISSDFFLERKAKKIADFKHQNLACQEIQNRYLTSLNSASIE